MENEKKGEGKQERKVKKGTRKCNSSITNRGTKGISDFQTSQPTLTIRIHSTENKRSSAVD